MNGINLQDADCNQNPFSGLRYKRLTVTPHFDAISNIQHMAILITPWFDS